MFFHEATETGFPNRQDPFLLRLFGSKITTVSLFFSHHSEAKMTQHKNQFWMKSFLDKNEEPSDTSFNENHGYQNIRYKVSPSNEYFCQQLLP